MKVITNKSISSRSGTRRVGGATTPAAFTRGHVERMRALLQVAMNHPWTFASVDSVARSVVAPGWDIVPVPRYDRGATEIQRKRLEEFFEYSTRTWSNIKDYQSFEDKLHWTISSRRLIGSAGWEIVRNGAGKPIGFDILPGVVVPNTDTRGKLLSPAFTFFPWDVNDAVTYERDEIVYFANTGLSGVPFGESIYISLLNSSLPSDMFASVAYRSMFENVSAPYNGIWEVDPAVSDTDFDMFLALLEERYTGAANFGRNPLVIRGAVNYKPVTSRTKEDAPYLEGRNYNRSELSAVTGVDGNKMGVTENTNKSNMRETQREFLANVVKYTASVMESDIYYQVCSRLFGIDGWMLKLREPGVSTPIEQASIDMRNLQFGVFSPNEIRKQHGFDPRPGGDIYYTPGNMSNNNQNAQGEPANDRESSTKVRDNNPEPKTPPERTPRSDDVQISNSVDGIIADLRRWKKIKLEELDRKRTPKVFNSTEIPDKLLKDIRLLLEDESCGFDETKIIFDTAIQECRERIK